MVRGKVGVVVLAAEQSERMRSVLPPALHTVAGVPAAQYVIDAAKDLEPETIVVVVRKADANKALVGAELVLKSRLETLPGALAGCDSLLVVRGDVPLVESELLASLIEARAGEQLAFVASKAGDGVGPWCADAAWLWDQVNLKSGDLLAALEELVRTKEYPEGAVVATGNAALRIDARASLAEVESVVRGQLIEAHLAAGVTFRDPATAYLERSVQIEADVCIEPNCYLYGETSIAAGSVIGPGVTLRNASIGSNSRVEHSVVEDSSVGMRTTVGPFAHVRAGAVIGDRCEIHNYAEVKNSVLGDGVKVHHFSYLGDAEVGEEANIGAGAVTVNFDGKDKHPTRIGARAFVGCDTMLIAPISVGDGAFTAAGAVVTRNVEPGVRVAGVPARELPGKEERVE